MIARRSLIKILAAPICACGCSSLLWHRTAFGQKKMGINAKKGCSYDGRASRDDVYGFAASKDAEAFIGAICGKVGLPPNFVTMAANVPNAAAIIDEDTNQRLVLYSEVFMAEIAQRAKTDWAGMSILAHEVGHHLSGHTLTGGGSRPPTELEADKFSGFIVARMGGTLDEASAVMKLIPPEGSETHPPRSARLEAIASGWRSAMADQGSSPAMGRPAVPQPTTPSSASPQGAPPRGDVNSLFR
jgi:hypothetical protein